jgi:hypothetical protein
MIPEVQIPESIREAILNQDSTVQHKICEANLSPEQFVALRKIIIKKVKKNDLEDSAKNIFHHLIAKGELKASFFESPSTRLSSDQVKEILLEPDARGRTCLCYFFGNEEGREELKKIVETYDLPKKPLAEVILKQRTENLSLAHYCFFHANIDQFVKECHFYGLTSRNYIDLLKKENSFRQRPVDTFLGQDGIRDSLAGLRKFSASPEQYAEYFVLLRDCGKKSFIIDRAPDRIECLHLLNLVGDFAQHVFDSTVQKSENSQLFEFIKNYDKGLSFITTSFMNEVKYGIKMISAREKVRLGSESPRSIPRGIDHSSNSCSIGLPLQKGAKV